MRRSLHKTSLDTWHLRKPGLASSCNPDQVEANQNKKNKNEGHVPLCMLAALTKCGPLIDHTVSHLLTSGTLCANVHKIEFLKTWEIGFTKIVCTRKHKAIFFHKRKLLWNWLSPARFFSYKKTEWGFGVFFGEHVGGVHSQKDEEGEEEKEEEGKEKDKEQ